MGGNDDKHGLLCEEKNSGLARDRGDTCSGAVSAVIGDWGSVGGEGAGNTSDQNEPNECSLPGLDSFGAKRLRIFCFVPIGNSQGGWGSQIKEGP